MIRRGPKRVITNPSVGTSMMDAANPIEKTAAVTPRSQPNSSRMGGKKSENEVRALTPTDIVTKAIPTTTQP